MGEYLCLDAKKNRRLQAAKIMIEWQLFNFHQGSWASGRIPAQLNYENERTAFVFWDIVREPCSADSS